MGCSRINKPLPLIKYSLANLKTSADIMMMSWYCFCYLHILHVTAVGFGRHVLFTFGNIELEMELCACLFLRCIDSRNQREQTFHLVLKLCWSWHRCSVLVTWSRSVRLPYNVFNSVLLRGNLTWICLYVISTAIPCLWEKVRVHTNRFNKERFFFLLSAQHK